MVESIRKQFMRIGLYYSLSEWFHPVFLRDQTNNYKTQHYVSVGIFLKIRLVYKITAIYLAISCIEDIFTISKPNPA